MPRSKIDNPLAGISGPIGRRKQLDCDNVAIVGLNPNSATAEEANFAKAFTLNQSCVVDTFSLYGSDLTNTLARDSVNNFSFFSNEMVGRYDVVVFSGSVMLYDTEWHSALVTRAARMLKDDGALFIGGVKINGIATLAGLSLETLEGWLKPDTTSKEGRYTKFHQPQNTTKTAQNSILNWYVERGPVYARASASGFSGATETSLTALGIHRGPNTLANEGDTFPNISGPDFGPINDNREVVRADFHSLEYLSLGAGMKSAFLKGIIKDNFAPDRILRLCDHGSAAGMAPIQLLLEPDLNIEYACAVEPSQQFLTMTADIYTQFHKQLAGRFFYDHAYAEEYEYPEPLDVISMMHMLLLVHPEKRASYLGGAFNALRPGGVLVVLEIPKTEKSSSAGYYEKMLPRQEIEALLDAFGPITCYHPKELRKISSAEAKESAVFRTVKKT